MKLNNALALFCAALVAVVSPAFAQRVSAFSDFEGSPSLSSGDVVSAAVAPAPSQPDKDAAIATQFSLAQKYQWARAWNRAIAEFQKVLAMDPGNVRARIAIGQCYLGKGDLATARETFEKILAEDPNRSEAEVQLGYLELYTDPWVAEDRAERLAIRFPGNSEVTAFRATKGKVRAPTVTTSFEHSEDDKKVLSTDKSRVEASFAFRKLDLTLVGSKNDFKTGVGAKAKVESGTALAEWRVGGGQRLSLRAGMDQITGTKGATKSVGVGSLSWEYGRARRFQGRISFDRDAARVAPDVADDGIVTNGVSGTLSRQFGGLTVEGDLGFTKFTGNRPALDNERTSAGLLLRQKFIVGGILPVFFGYGFRWMSFDKPYQSFLFAPDDYRGHRGFVMTYGEKGRIQFFAYGELGGQKSVAGVGASRYETDYQGYLVGSFTFGYKIVPGIRLMATGVKARNSFEKNASRGSYFNLSLRWTGHQNSK